MATYVNDLRLKEIATGDESGTWGTSTNTNLELIAEAFSYGTEVITTNADTHTTTIADGATDPGRSLYLKYTGTLDSACTITIGPNTVSKVWIIENGTSGSQDIILSQGSGANITIPAGDTKVVYSDGAGAGAAFFDAFASLSVVDLKVQDDLTVTGDIDVDGTTNLDVVDIDGAVDMASTALVTGVLTANGGAVFNETGADVDFRVESDTVDHALFVQGSDGNVGIGTSSPGTTLDVIGPLRSNVSGGTPIVYLSNGTTQHSIQNTSGALTFFNDGTERMRIDSSGNLLVGTTDTFPGGGDTNTGVSLTNSGAVVASRDGDFAARFNRKTSDGDIVQFNIDGTTVGSIGSTSGFFFIGGTEGTDAYISFGSAGVRPATSAGAARDAAVDLGGSTNRFKDLHLSGGVYGSGSFSAGATGNGNWFAEGEQHIFRRGSAGSYAEFGRFDTSGNFLVGKTSSAFGAVGAALYASGDNDFVNDSNVMSLNRLSSDGSIISFYKDTSAVGSIGVTGGSFAIGQSNTGLGFFNTDRIVFPATSVGAVQDNAIDLGYASGRFDDIYATNGTIQHFRQKRKTRYRSSNRCRN
jgi:hypothetical protein